MNELKPVTADQTYLAKMAGVDVIEPKPVTANQMFLAKMAGMDVATPKPVTVDQMFMQKIIDNGGTGGSGGGSGGGDVNTCENMDFNTPVTFGGYSFAYVPVKNIRYAKEATFSPYSFASHNSLETVVGGANSKATISADAFGDCKSLKNVSFRMVSSVGERAFNGCTGLESCSIDGVNSGGKTTIAAIGVDAFADCSALKEVNGDIGGIVNSGAFRRCTSLEKIKLKNCTQIGGGAFYGCSKLTAVILESITSDVCVCDLTAIEGTPIMQGMGHIYVPTSVYEYYRAGYEEALNAEMGAGAFDFLFRKIEDYPEICG